MMDAAAERALAEVIRGVVARDLDALERRVAELERRAETPAPRRREYVAVRIRSAVDMRARGATLEEIAAKLGVVRATVQRDLLAAAAARQNGHRPAA